MKLYNFGRTRAARVTWTALELGVELQHKTVNLQQGEHMQPWFLELNPHHKVPVAEDLGTTLIESMGICLHLADSAENGEALMPARGTAERAEMWQWVLYGPATLDDPTIDAFLNAKVYPEARKDHALIERNAKAWKETIAPYLAKRLGDRDFLCGTFSLADVSVGYALFFAQALELLGEQPTLQAYMGRLMQRPAFAKAFDL